VFAVSKKNQKKFHRKSEKEEKKEKERRFERLQGGVLWICYPNFHVHILSW
jgi:hypothetical protein